MNKYLAECVGTMFLVLLACGSAVLAGPSIGGLGVGLCFGLVLLCLVYAIGNISGRIGFKDFVCYVVAQLFGAAIGAGILCWFVNMVPGFDFGGVTGESQLAANVLQPGATSGMALLAEGMLTFFFVFIVLGATDEQKGFGKFAGIAIGLAL